MAAWCDGMEGEEGPRVLIAPTPCISGGEGCILSLRHPKSDEETCYVFMDDRLHELNWFKQPYGSWFLGDYVCEDGGLYFCTPVDPIFVLLPIFDAARMSSGDNQGVFRQLDEILYIEGYPCYQHLMSIAQDHMKLVCEVKEVGDAKFYRLDNSKFLAWLLCKVQRLKYTFPKLGQNYAAQEEKELLKDVVQILREYLDEPWLKLLCRQLQLDMEDIINTTKTGPALWSPEFSPMPARPSEGNGTAKSSKGKSAKKQKTEVDSKNIKDMFSRATRSKSGAK